MERRGGDDRSANWSTFTGYFGNGRDANGGRIQGTPRATNSLFFPTPTPTWIPGRVVINEVLIRPHYDWEGKGGVTTDDEFIELYNLGPNAVNLDGWMLDDVADGGSRPFRMKAWRIPPGGFLVVFRTRSHIALNDGGDTVRLLAPNGRLIDRISYLKVRAYNLSYGRLPDGSSRMAYGLWPTPRRQNRLFIEAAAGEDVEKTRRSPYRCPDGSVARLLLPRFGRQPAWSRWLLSNGLFACSREGGAPGIAGYPGRVPTGPVRREGGSEG